MGHVGILLTALAFASGVLSITYTINLYQKIRIKYLKIHNFVFALLNYKIFVGMAFNYFQFNLRTELSESSARTILQIYHFHFSITTLFFFYGIILALYELRGIKWPRKWRMALLAVYVSLIVSQGLSSLFSVTISGASVYIFLLLFIYFSSYILIIILSIRFFLLSHTRKKNIKESVLKKFSLILLSIIILLMILSFMQGFKFMSTELYVLLLSICIFSVNLMPIKYMRDFLKKVFPEHISEDAADLRRQEMMEKFKISKREQEIIRLICLGKSNKEIEDELYISIQTVKDHIYNIYRKTGVKNRVQLTNLFR